jgi:hypothetical protein
MDFTLGEDRLLYIKINGNYIPVGCLTDSSISEGSNFIDTMTRDNEGWDTSRPISQSYSISFNGLQVNTTLAGGNFNIASYDKLRDLKRSGTLLEWKLQGDKYPLVDFGSFYIDNISDSEVVGELLSFSVSARGYGKPQQIGLASVLLNNGDPNVIVNNGQPDILIRIGEN